MMFPLTVATESFMRFNERRNVDLPEPDAPINEVIL